MHKGIQFLAPLTRFYELQRYISFYLYLYLYLYSGVARNEKWRTLLLTAELSSPSSFGTPIFHYSQSSSWTH